MEGGKTHPWSWIKRNQTGKVLIFYSSFSSACSSSCHLFFFLQHLDQKLFTVLGRDELRHGKE
jgi:hypothetical protein